jgi:nitrite reductase/ring-hydroxylating ferredoxin subunit
MKHLRYCLVVLLLISCTKTEEVRIPYRPVYLKLYLSFEDKELLSPGNFQIYTVKDVTALERVGFGGVIVYHSPFGGYVAYDLACPYEAKTSSLVEVREQGSPYAVCPHCKSEYDLSLGYPREGSVSTYRLQPYNVYTQSATELVVQN